MTFTSHNVQVYKMCKCINLLYCFWWVIRVCKQSTHTFFSQNYQNSNYPTYNFRRTNKNYIPGRFQDICVRNILAFMRLTFAITEFSLTQKGLKIRTDFCYPKFANIIKYICRQPKRIGNFRKINPSSQHREFYSNSRNTKERPIVYINKSKMSIET